MVDAWRTEEPAEVTELRFPRAGAGHYLRWVWVAVLGVMCTGLGLMIMNLDQSPGYDLTDFKGVLTIAFGAFAIVIALLMLVSLPILNRRCWGQFLRPAAVVDAVGVRYLLRGKQVVITGRDIAEIRLARTNYTSRATGRRWSKTRVDLLLEPDADRNRDGMIQVPESRRLEVGRLEEVDVLTADAVSFLREIAGPLLVTTERAHKVGRWTLLGGAREIHRATRRRPARW